MKPFLDHAQGVYRNPVEVVAVHNDADVVVGPETPVLPPPSYEVNTVAGIL